MFSVLENKQKIWGCFLGLGMDQLYFNGENGFAKLANRKKSLVMEQIKLIMQGCLFLVLGVQHKSQVCDESTDQIAHLFFP